MVESTFSFRQLKKSDLIFLTPSFYSWTLIGIYILFYVFDLVDYVELNNLNLFGNSFLLMALWGFPAAITISFTGTYIDLYPSHLRNLIIISMLGCSFSLLIDLFSLITYNSLLMCLTTFTFGFFSGILIISGQTLYGISIPQITRGKAYSIVIASFLFISIVLVIFFGPLLSKEPFMLPLTTISILGIVLCIIFVYITNQYDFTWVNNEWPTKLKRILTRQSVIVYFWSHTLIWTMLGLMIGSLAYVGENATNTLIHPINGLDPYKTFWIVVLIGSIIFIFPSGYLSDLLGRKTLIIFATTGIVLASLIIGIFESSFAYYLSTFLIGVSFACVHTSLDSSLWIDLASRDSIGRYNSLNFQSLGLGFAIGFLISYYFYLELFPNFLSVNIFILLGLTVFASLPLFWISDSYPPLEFFLLLVTNSKSGIPLFHYNFRSDESLKVDLPLISGAFTALSSFMVEATGEQQGRLSLIRHGTHFIISDESSLGLTGAIFSNKNDPELQRLLKKFLQTFQTKYRDEILSWQGNLDAFSDAVNDAEDIFGHLITIKT